MMRIRTTPRHDMQDVKYLLKRIHGMKTFYADRGYDAEWLHEMCYWSKVQTFIPSRKNVKIRKFRKKTEEVQPINKKSKAWIWILVVLLLMAGGVTAWILLSGGDVGSAINAGNSIPQPPALPS